VKDFLKKVLPPVLIIFKKPAFGFYDICVDDAEGVMLKTESLEPDEK